MAVSDASRDDTRVKLVEAAGELFAKVGYETATVREICKRAGVNIASVNYHFGDKLGLYTEVLLQRARFAERAAQAATVDGTPEEQLRAFIHAYLTGLVGKGPKDDLVKLIAAEVARPSPALKRVVKQIVRPTEARVRTLVGQIVNLPPEDDKVRMCTHSIIGQCLHYKNAAPVLGILWPDLWRTPDRLERLAHHIVSFSLSALYAVRDSSEPTRQTGETRHGGKG